MRNVAFQVGLTCKSLKEFSFSKIILHQKILLGSVSKKRKRHEIQSDI